MCDFLLVGTRGNFAEELVESVLGTLSNLLCWWPRRRQSRRRILLFKVEVWIVERRLLAAASPVEIAIDGGRHRVLGTCEAVNVYAVGCRSVRLKLTRFRPCECRVFNLSGLTVPRVFRQGTQLLLRLLRR